MAETYSFLIYAVFALTHLAIVATTFITGPLKKGHKASFFLSLPSFLLSGVSRSFATYPSYNRRIRVLLLILSLYPKCLPVKSRDKTQCIEFGVKKINPR